MLVSLSKGFTIDGKVEDEPADQDEYNDFYRSQGGDAFENAYRDKLIYISSECIIVRFGSIIETPRRAQRLLFNQV